MSLICSPRPGSIGLVGHSSRWNSLNTICLRSLAARAILMQYFDRSRPAARTQAAGPPHRRPTMHIINRIAAFHDDMKAWRRDIHAHPETAFEERRTAAQIADKLRGWGIEVHEGLAKTGVVGTLRCGSSTRAIGLRADIDALPMEELNDFAHRSTGSGKFHGCGYDGHTAMLLGAARFLAEARNFDGTVHFIFQPAEENVAGAGVMVRDG